MCIEFHLTSVRLWLSRTAGDHGPFNCWDRLPFLTDVASGSPSLVQAFNTLESNFFLPCSEPYPIDSDDGCNHLNVSSNVLMGNAAWKTDFGGHTKRFTDNAIMYPYNPGWAHGGVTCEMDDGTNVFSRNKVVGVAHPYNCGNDTDTCRGPEAATPRNFSCVCPQGGTPHFTPPGNATSCATVSHNQYWMPPKEAGGGANSTVAVCPPVSRVESGSVLHYGMPDSAALIRMARSALGMPTH